MELNPNTVTAPTVSPAHESHIGTRWLLWQPAIIMESRKQPDPYAALQLYKTTHRSRFIAILSAGIRWRVMVRNNLDNPLHSHAEFEMLLHAALQRGEGYAKRKISPARKSKSTKKYTRNFD